MITTSSALDLANSLLRSCPSCGGATWRAALTTAEVRIVTCAACTLGQTLPPPAESDGGEALSKDAAYYRRFYEEQSEFRRRLTIPMLQVLAEFASTGQILDVGCGLGFFLDVASRHGGYRCVGIDMSTAATDFARCTLGLDVRTGDFSKERFAEVFDAITMNHVLEHISAPVPFLERARTVLAPGGIVVSSSPNFAGWLARALGARWYGLQPSQHVWQFTPASYATLFRRAGFSVLAVRTGSLYYPWGPGWKAPAVWGVARAAAILGHGDNMFLVARRP